MRSAIEIVKQVEEEGFAPIVLFPEIRRLIELVRADEREVIKDECLLRVNAELVEALKYCRQKIAYMQANGEWYSPGRAIEKADAALAKATGETK